MGQDHHREHRERSGGFHHGLRRQTQSLLLGQSDAHGDGQEGEEDRHRRDRIQLADLDPNDDETSEAGKQRYLQQLNGGSFQPAPTCGLDSGNGVQCLWRLDEPLVLGEPVWVAKGKKRELVFSPEDQAKIDDAEARTRAVMVRLGAKPGTQNIDRVLRLPGTINLPNAKKRKAGRVPCRTKLLWFKNTRHPPSAFPKDDEAKGPEPQKEEAAQREELEVDPFEELAREQESEVDESGSGDATASCKAATTGA